VKNISAASYGTVSYAPRIPDRAAVVATALERIFSSSAPVWERRQAAVDYLRDQLTDVERQAAARETGENFHAQLDFFNQPPSTDPLLGLAVKLPDACRKCADAAAIVGPGKPPHYASLHCRSCNLHRGWLSRAHRAHLNELIAIGLPREQPIALTRTSKPDRATPGSNTAHNPVA
jgi:hypothetical protein